MIEYWVGVDGGGTHTRARIRDRAGKLLGEGRAAGSNLELGIEVAHANVLAQQIMVMDLDRKEGPEPGYNLDTWAGYSIPRQRLLDRLRERRIGKEGGGEDVPALHGEFIDKPL